MNTNICFYKSVFKSFVESVTYDLFQLEHFSFVLKLLETPLARILENTTNAILIEHYYRYNVKYFE
jgi:hypothetical protein